MLRIDTVGPIANHSASDLHEPGRKRTMSKAIDIDQVRNIGVLSRIELSDEQARELAGQLGAIVEYFDKLKELDTDGVEPMVHALEKHNVLADDVPGESLAPDKALANAPARDGDFFKVPKVIGDS